MARFPAQIGAASPVAGYGAALFIAGVLALAICGIVSAAPPTVADLPWRYIGSVLWFSGGQALLSTLLSLILGGALALMLARRQNLPGYRLILAVLDLAAVMPVIVAVLGIVGVFGRAGWLGQLAAEINLPWGSWLYGLPGIVLAHIFFNIPLAARSAFLRLRTIPSEHWRLASHLGMGPLAVWRFIDWPALRQEAVPTGTFIFFLCFTSFTAVLALGGGPGAATLQVAIFEAIRFEADLGRAGILSLLQMAICCAFAWPLLRLSTPGRESFSTGYALERPDRSAAVTHLLDGLSLGIMLVIILLPLASLCVAGLKGWKSLFQAETAHAVLASLMIAIPAGSLAVLLGFGLAGAARHARLKIARPRLADGFGLLSMAVLLLPPFTLAAGLFVMVRRVADPFALGGATVVLINALMALPYAYRHIEPALTLSEERYGRLADSLGLRGWNRFRLVDWPLLRRPLIHSLAIAVALSLGDLGVIALFGSGDLVTLPLLIYERMGAYRMDEAAAAALLILLGLLGLFGATQSAMAGIEAKRPRTDNAKEPFRA